MNPTPNESEFPPMDQEWTSDHWTRWAYKVGLKLDRFFNPFGVDNRIRIEKAIDLLINTRTPAPQPNGSNELLGLAIKELKRISDIKSLPLHEKADIDQFAHDLEAGLISDSEKAELRAKLEMAKEALLKIKTQDFPEYHCSEGIAETTLTALESQVKEKGEK